MTKEQIEMLKELIRNEIKYETRWSRDSHSLIVRENLNEKWGKFSETFSPDTEPFETDV